MDGVKDIMKVLQKKDDRVTRIQNGLIAGKTREDMAKKLGYSNWRSLDIFMRRKGMRWDAGARTYYYPVERNESTEEEEISNSPKISSIISLFNKKDADPKEVAEQVGFKDHHELAAYMKSKGYIWSMDINNYIIASCEYMDNLKEEEKTGDTENLNSGEERQIPVGDYSKYVRFLDELLKNKERLDSLLSSYHSSMPRYIVPGITRTKSFYMSDKLSRLVNEFSKRKNISQKEIVETALIEFLCKYSFHQEVDELLRKY